MPGGDGLPGRESCVVKKQLRSRHAVRPANGFHRSASGRGDGSNDKMREASRQTTSAVTPRPDPAATGGRAVRAHWWGAAAIAGILAWSYWPTLTRLWSIWRTNEDYSAGQVVPLVAAYLLWSDRKQLAALPKRTCWWGLAPLLLAQAVRGFAVFFDYGSLEQYSLILTIAAMVLLVAGFPAVWRMKWVLLFLVLMAPLPRRVHSALAHPLQEIATSTAIIGLESLGFLVWRDGNVLRLNDQFSVAVAEACSGLRMLTAFFVVSAAMAFLIRRPTWQKCVLLGSSIPVSILANTLRLIVTVVLYGVASSEVAESFFHDFAGLTMMPIAVAASLGLLYLLQWLTAGSAPRAAEACKQA